MFCLVSAREFIKQYAVPTDSSSSLKCSIFCALSHQNEKFAIDIKLIFYLIFLRLDHSLFDFDKSRILSLKAISIVCSELGLVFI